MSNGNECATRSEKSSSETDECRLIAIPLVKPLKSNRSIGNSVVLSAFPEIN